MNQHRDIEALLDHWFEDGPEVSPDRVIDAVANRIERQPQRTAWRLHWRPLHMNVYSKLALAAAAVLIVAVVGYSLLPAGSSNVGGPAATPTPTATASSAAASATPAGTPFPCDEPGNGCAGNLTAGEHTSTAFSPSLTYLVPAGWQNTLDKARGYTLHPPGYTFDLRVASEVAIPGQNAGCTPERKAGVGNAVADWSEFLTTHPGLTASTPEPVTVGGYAGVSIAFNVNSTWTATCPDSLGPAVTIMTDGGNPPTRVVWIDDQYTIFTILDVGGQTVIIDLESGPNPATSEQDKTTIQPILDSFRFAPAN